ncbi:MAG TPA: oxygenase MpaB family protein [Sphingomicrobium sp.]|jgi:uncharacterized protein (DUF2236 family)|nr:oxygenase MpaB family protein [Sphingomicrobium sp.]
MSFSPPRFDAIRHRIAGEVVSFFNDAGKGQQPIVSSDHALVPRGSVAWRVHGDVAGMMVGGIAALLLQMLHPQALAGVWDHSDFQKNMHGRLRNTARFIAVTTYGHRDEALAAIGRVRQIHDHVNGTLPDGTPYDANDPRLLAFVHLAGSAMFLAGWRKFGEPGMTLADRDAYWADVAPIGRLLGAGPLPVTDRAAQMQLNGFITELRADERSRTVRDIILNAPSGKLRALPIQALLMQSAVDLLPPWARRMHGLRSSGIGALGLGAATYGLASTLRWALQPR